MQQPPGFFAAPAVDRVARAPSVVEAGDAPANTSTSYSLSAGQTARGQLSTLGDHDWFKVSLVAGQTYTFILTGTGTNNVRDTFLRLYGPDGATLLASNDNGLQGGNSVITFTANTTGTYYLDVGAAINGFTGEYGLSMANGARGIVDIEMGAGIIDTDFSWSATPGTGANITYAFRATGGGNQAAPNFSLITPEQMAAIRRALAQFAEVANVTFTEVNPGSYSDNATMLFGNYFSSTDGAGAFAYYPGSTASNAYEGDVWLNTNWVSTSSLPYGSYSFYTVLHEIGHAMGLSHPGVYNAAPGVSITYNNNAQFTQDTHQYSVMSYFDEVNTSGNLGGYPDTLMLMDIYALQRIYGANTSTRSGDTVYGFGSNAGAPYDFSVNSAPGLTIWDGGGNDTLNLSGYSANQTITLVAGEFSSVGGLTGNLSIALGAVIENAIGGSGNDTITGNSVANVLVGGSGNDTLYGGDGNDTLDGGLGTDSLYGQVGDDTFLFSSPNNGADTIFDFGSTDRIALSGAAFGLVAGSLAGAGVDFTYGSAAGSSGPELFYNAANNRLYWDADGTGAGAAIELALFSGGLGGTLGTMGSNYVSEATGDFDRNGISDVLWRDTTTGATGAWLLNANGVSTWSAMGTVANGWDAKVSGDFDGSGTSDVLWRNETTGATGAWLMRNGQPTGWLSLGTTNLAWDAEGVGDFDRNGIKDIFWVNDTTRRAGAWLMNASGQPGGWLDLGTVNPGWEFKGVGDFNGDGTDDVLFYNTATRALGAWNIRNGVPVGWFAFGTVEADWAIDSVLDLNGDGTDDLHLYNANTDSAKGFTVVNGVVTGTLTQPGFDGNWALVGAGQFNGSGAEDLLWRNTVTGAVVVNSLGLTASQFIIV